MGGGFAAKVLSEKQKKVSKKPKREEWFEKTSKSIKQEKVSSKTLSKETLNSDSSSDEEASAPNLKEVTIKNVRVNLERLHKNIVKFKHKQYSDFIEKQKKTEEIKSKKKADTKDDKKSETKDGKKADTKEVKKSQKVLKVTSDKKSRLFEKFGIDTDTSSDSEAENITKQVDNKKKILKTKKVKEENSTKKSNDEKENANVKKKSDDKKSIKPDKKSKAKKWPNEVIKTNIKKEKTCDKASDEEEPVKDIDTSVVANPFFDQPEEENHDRENEKDKLVEMLYSLIKGNKGLQDSYEVKKEKESTEAASEPLQESETAKKIDSPIEPAEAKKPAEAEPTAEKVDNTVKKKTSAFDDLFAGNTGPVSAEKPVLETDTATESHPLEVNISVCMWKLCRLDPNPFR